MRSTKGYTIKESDIQKAILEYLQYSGYYVWKNHSTGIFNAKGGGFIPTGKPGVSDILGILPNGRFLAIEVKKPKGRLSEHQVQFIDDINKNKGLAFVAYSIDDVQTTFKNNNVHN